MSKRQLPQAEVPVKDGDRAEDLFSDDDSDEYESEADEEIVQASGSESESDDEGQVWLPGTQLAADEVLEPDMTAYEMLHSVTAKWPCLTFDVLWDDLGEQRRTYPATAHFVAGTQADVPKHNEIQVVKLSGLSRDDDSDDDEPTLAYTAIRVNAGVNRIRATRQRDRPRRVCALTEDGAASIYDVDLDFSSSLSTSRPLHVVQSVEGFAVDWSNTGRLVTGDNAGEIRVTDVGDGYTTGRPFTGHTSSVEDLGWSPSEATVFSSCSADGTVRIWDTRSRKRVSALSYTAAQCDVNVLSWNANVAYLLATGADDGRLSVWDLRSLKSVASLDWHRAPITSLEWHPHDESVLAASGADDQTTLWDLSVEHDPEEMGGVQDVPPQLMFSHMGQHDVKELHWHPQLPGVVITTAASGFNLFKSAHQS